MVGFEGIL